MRCKSVVTGGAGFVGSHIVDELLADGQDVHVVDNLATGKRENVNAHAALHEVDIRDYDALLSVMEGATYVFHEAALARVQLSIENPALTHEVNITGTLCVLRAAADRQVKRLIYAASSSAYGNQKTLPLDESMPANPLSPYGLQKHVGELYCRLFSTVYNLQTVCLRYFNVYGPRFDPSGPYALVIGKFLRQRSLGEPLTITGDGEQTRDFTHVSDVARANLLAMTSEKVGHGEVLNIGAGRNCSINHLAEIIGGPTVHVPPRLEPRHTRADNRRARELLGWVPTVALADGVMALKS
ncbi:MAG: SDR family oxidoreductase [Candidatus Schekmanbacteria bacterium]|nr:SDR family oxidoreductase [Candidatus Schekmanbacteria bacterium]